jgi:hypothetical protein
MTRTEYYDIILKETFDIPVFDNVTPEDLRSEYDDTVYRAIYQALQKLAVRPDWDNVPCFQMNDVIFEVDRDDYVDQLTNCLNYFTQTEEYEICADLVRLQKTLEKDSQ